MAKLGKTALLLAFLSLSSSFLKLLCSPLPDTAGLQPATVALTHRASPFTAPKPGRPQLGVAEPGQPWPGHSVIRPAASTPRRPVHLNLGLLLADEQPATSPVTPPTAAVVSCVQRPEEEEEGVNRK